MVPIEAIIKWENNYPWANKKQVEQDLIISRALVAIYNDDFLASRLAFRGETALHKLYLSPQSSYSEDIDLVQIQSENIGAIIDKLREVLSFLGKPVIKQKKNNNTMVFRVVSTFPPVTPIRLKVEINCKEHFMDEKMQEDVFLKDTQALLRPSLIFNPQVAYEVVRKELIEKIY